MRRFSIRALMGRVLALAVGLAASCGANEYWAGGLLLATPLLFGIALIGGLCGKVRSRARADGILDPGRRLLHPGVPRALGGQPGQAADVEAAAAGA